jgi:hypothetical protein
MRTLGQELVSVGARHGDYDAHDVMEFGHHRRLAGSFPTGAMLTASFNTVPHFPQAGVSSPCGFRSFTTTQAPSSQGSSKIRHTHCRVNCLAISSLAAIRDVEGPASTRMLGGRSFFIGQQPGPTLSAQSDSRQCRRSPRAREAARAGFLNPDLPYVRVGRMHPPFRGPLLG